MNYKIRYTTDGITYKEFEKLAFSTPVSGGAINGARVSLSATHSFELEFDNVYAQGVQIIIYGTNASNNNVVLTEIFVYGSTSTYFFFLLRW